jgi:flagellar biosynthetic protein FliR
MLDPVALWLVAARFTGLALAAPALSGVAVPRRVRAALVIWLAVFTVPLVEVPQLPVAVLPWHVATEILCGAAFGLLLRLVVAAVDLGATLVDSEMGFLAAGQFNPLLQTQAGPFATLWGAVALLLVWLLDLIPLALGAVSASFAFLPPGRLAAVADWATLSSTAGDLFAAGLVIAAPVLALCFLVNIVLGVAARAVQGLNVFTEGFNLRLVAGGAAIVLFLPLLLLLVRHQVQHFAPLATAWFGRIPAHP